MLTSIFNWPDTMSKFGNYNVVQRSQTSLNLVVFIQPILHFQIPIVRGIDDGRTREPGRTETERFAAGR